MLEATTEALIALGSLFLAGLAAELVGRHTHLPRVTLFLLLGFAVGPAGLDLLPAGTENWFSPVSIVALVMVGFLLGGEFTRSEARERGHDVLVVSAVVVVVTALTVFLGLLAIGASAPVALALAAVAPATDPAATADVARENGAKGPFTRTLLGIVAVDDAWAVIAFGLMLACMPLASGEAWSLTVLLAGVWEVVGAVLVGLVLGYPLALLTGRVRPGEPTLAEALGAVLLCGGVSLWLEVSYLLAAITMGAVVVNRAAHHRRPFRAIEGIEWPFLSLFFILAGATLRPRALLEVGAVGLAYVLLRVAGRLLGARGGGRLARSKPAIRKWMGASLLPQAGVAVGMTLVLTQQYPELEDVVLPIVIGSTVLFELVGPVVTKGVLGHLGELDGGSGSSD